jgi:threonine/homoserine/homoserine lactone efflux protein
VQIVDEVDATGRRSFWLALATQLSNPKTAVVYASVFVPLALSAPSPRAAYLRSKTWIDRAAGTVMALLGLRLILSTR